MSGLLDCNPARRTAAEWRGLLSGPVESLSAHVGRPLQETSWFAYDDQPGYASACNCVDVRATISLALSLEVCGVIWITVNFGEAAWVDGDLLFFASGRRLKRL